ncbi:glutamine--tRNA ligase-like [Symsagittifera roscoffensis]|uniref:glutamine--tRNA ligase-like n=1 Tax=Symsagittifera roscoffensis TaxID=84072 RepID=UPI00307BD8A5
MSLDLFMSVGLSEQRAKETLKNKQLSDRLNGIILTASKLTPHSSPHSIDKSQGQLLYHCATKLKDARSVDQVLPYIMNRKVSSEMQVNAVQQYFMDNPVGDVNISEFEELCGIGVDVTKDDIVGAVKAVIEEHRSKLIEERYQYPIGQLISDVKTKQPNMKWADGKVVKQTVDACIEHLLGPKTEQDSNKKKRQPTVAYSQAPSKPATVTIERNGSVNGTMEEDNDSFRFDQSEEKADMFKGLKLHGVGENHTTEGYLVTDENMKRLEAHKERANGVVHTRFPPEPNGILHIGHAKAININFGFAKAHGGHCNLRYDDTNPEKEEERYFTGILDMVRWLGYEPHRITHSSDFFDTLYQHAVTLIKKGLAYVCHQQFDDINFKAKDVCMSPWRDRPMVESLQLFEDMRAGLFDEGEATLRAKYIMEDGKVDPVLYRIKFCEHHRSKDKWCIYPTYDFTHPLCDSIEDITHSLCTKEFQSHRSMYYWLCDAVDVYCPVQWEYGRLNMNYSVVSKRKILKLIETGHVKDWDDPRLFTLPALRRKGYPHTAVNDFVHRLGVTMAQVTIDPEMLEFCVRTDLNRNARRVMAISSPLRVLISNFEASNLSTNITIPDFPESPEKGSRTVTLTKEIFIDASDFLEKADKNFKRLTLSQPVGLKYADQVLSAVKVEFDKEGDISYIVGEISPRSDSSKPKGYIQWVSCDYSLPCTFRLYDRLFLHKCPEDKAEVPGGFLSDINPHSLTQLKGARVDCRAKDAQQFDKFQFERIGYFSVDPDSSVENGLIFNRTVTLKEDSSKTF